MEEGEWNMKITSLVCFPSKVFKSCFADTQATLVCADSVVVAWTRGMQRLLLSGIIRRDDCEVPFFVAELVF